MQTSTLVILFIIIILLIVNIYLIYKSRKEFECPDCTCPECEEVARCQTPSNKAIVIHLINYFIDPIIRTDEPKEFMEKNMIFSNAKEILFEEDYTKVHLQLKEELIENRYRFNENNLRYMYPPNAEKEKEFVDLYKLTDFPTPLVTFKGTNILLGYVNVVEKWKFFINNNIFLKNNEEEEESKQ